MDVKEVVLEGVDWIRLAHEKDKWNPLVKTVINVGFHQRREISLVAMASL
jgi:hypothetical protein